MEQCLIIVGRSRSARNFTKIIDDALSENLAEEEFDVILVDSLGDLSELDGMSRYISFIIISEEAKKAMKMEQLSSSLIGMQMGIRLFENIEDAEAYAAEHYNYTPPLLEEDGEVDDDEEYPRFQAEEIEDFLIFESLFRTQKLATIRGSLYGHPVTVMAQIINGPDQIRVTPYAVMVSEDIQANLELPNIDERD